MPLPHCRYEAKFGCIEERVPVIFLDEGKVVHVAATACPQSGSQRRLALVGQALMHCIVAPTAATPGRDAGGQEYAHEVEAHRGRA